MQTPVAQTIAPAPFACAIDPIGGGGCAHATVKSSALSVRGTVAASYYVQFIGTFSGTVRAAPSAPARAVQALVG